MKSLCVLPLLFSLAIICGCSPAATPPNNANNTNNPAPTNGNSESEDYDTQIANALQIEDEAARVAALGEIAVAAAKDKNQDATVNALEEIKKVGLKGSGRPEDYTPLEQWTRDAAMALARSTKDPNVGIRLVEQFVEADALKLKKLTDDVMLEWTKVPGDVRDKIKNRIPGLN